MKRAGILGVAAAIALTLTAFAGTAAATPTELEAQVYPATLSGETQPYQTLSTVVGAVDCETSLAGSLTEASDEVPATFAGACQSFGSWYEIETNECEVELNLYWETFAIGPEGCGPMTVQVGTCVISIPAQQGLPAEYETVAGNPSKVKVTSQATSLTYTTSTYGACGSNDTTFEDGELLGSWLVSGTYGEEPNSISLEERGYDDIYEAESHPATLSGNQEMSDVFGTEAGDVSCEVASTGTLTEEAFEPLELAPTYSECEAFGFLEATVEANGCTFAYLGTLTHEAEIECPEGKAITIEAAFCALEIPEQSSLGDIGYENTSASGNMAFEVTPSIEGLEYTVTNDGFFCPFIGTGTRTDGTVTGTTLVQGVDEEGSPVNIRVNG